MCENWDCSIADKLTLIKHYSFQSLYIKYKANILMFELNTLKAKATNYKTTLADKSDSKYFATATGVIWNSEWKFKQRIENVKSTDTHLKWLLEGRLVFVFVSSLVLSVSVSRRKCIVWKLLTPVAWLWWSRERRRTAGSWKRQLAAGSRARFAMIDRNRSLRTSRTLLTHNDVYEM